MLNLLLENSLHAGLEKKATICTSSVAGPEFLLNRKRGDVAAAVHRNARFVVCRCWVKKARDVGLLINLEEKVCRRACLIVMLYPFCWLVVMQIGNAGNLTKGGDISLFQEKFVGIPVFTRRHAQKNSNLKFKIKQTAQHFVKHKKLYNRAKC